METLIGIPEEILKKWISQLNAETVNKEDIAKEMDAYLNPKTYGSTVEQNVPD